jgi:Na+-driven multidrug efflux pump
MKSFTFWAKKLLKTNIKIALILVVIYSLAYPFIGGLFNSDERVVELFKGTFWIVIIAQPFNAIAFTFDGIFKGLGKAVILRNTLSVATFFVFLPVIYLLNYFQPKLYCIWIALTLWMVYRGISLMVKFKKIRT